MKKLTTLKLSFTIPKGMCGEWWTPVANGGTPHLTYDHEKVFANLLWHCHCSRKIFTAPKVISSHLQNSNFCIILNHFGSRGVLKGYESKRSPSPYVFVYKNCSRILAIMLFVSAGTHDHEEVLSSLLYHCHSSRKFLRHTNSSEVSHKTIFFCII